MVGFAPHNAEQPLLGTEFFICYLPAPQPTLDHCQRDSLINQDSEYNTLLTHWATLPYRRKQRKRQKTYQKVEESKIKGD